MRILNVEAGTLNPKHLSMCSDGLTVERIVLSIKASPSFCWFHPVLPKILSFEGLLMKWFIVDLLSNNEM